MERQEGTRIGLLAAHSGRRISQDVHLVPLGREVDRAVLPFVSQDGRPALLHAHRVILLVPANNLARRVAAKVEASLKGVSIVEREDLAGDRNRPTAGMNGILQQISRICRRELELGNRVHINLSSGSKLVAFAAGLAGMAHLGPGRGSIYYAQPAGFTFSEADFEKHGHTKGIQDVEELELMPVLLPEPIQLRVLNFLRHHPDMRAEYRDIVKFITEIPGSDYSAAHSKSAQRVRNWNNAITTRMVRKILSPLQRNGLLEIFDSGRQKSAVLTTRGLLYSSISGLEKARLRAPLAAITSTTSTDFHGPG